MLRLPCGIWRTWARAGAARNAPGATLCPRSLRRPRHAVLPRERLAAASHAQVQLDPLLKWLLARRIRVSHVTYLPLKQCSRVL